MDALFFLLLEGFLKNICINILYQEILHMVV